MEALMVACAALVALVLINAGYWLAISLMRWGPALIAGAVAGWFALRHGLDPMAALALGALTSGAARHLLRRTSDPHA